MGAYRLSVACEIDISEIYEYGIEKFGLNQAQEYLIGLHDLFQTLSKIQTLVMMRLSFIRH